MERDRRASYDYYLVLATAVVLAIISAICVYAMFYFKFAQLQQMPPQVKETYLEAMNGVVSPFVIALILLLAICVPKRLLPVVWLNRFATGLGILVLVLANRWGMALALQVTLWLSLALQGTVLVMAVAGNQQLNFSRKGYWVRVGSSSLHLGLILFILDLFLYRQQGLHLVLFWMTTACTVFGMLACFYSQGLARVLGRGSGLGEEA